MRIFAKRRGFTLVEILITLALLSIMLVIAYDVMSRMLFSGTVTQWETTLTTDFTNADSRIRDYLNASSYPSLLTPQGNAVLNYNPPASTNDKFMLQFPSSGADKSFDDMGSAQTIMRWYRCEDGRNGIEGVPNQPPRAKEITLKTVPKGRTKQKNIAIADLVMEEKPFRLPETVDQFLAGSLQPDGNATTSRMVSDVEGISLKLFSRASGTLTLPLKDRVQVEIEIRCVEPVQGNAKRTRKITAEANVGAKPLSGS